MGIGDQAAKVYGIFRERFHESRADLFVRLLRPEAGSTLLDLGGGDGSLARRIVARVPLDVTVSDPEPTRFAATEAGFHVMEAKPGVPLPFEDGAFDHVLCNSVIEHATVWKDGCSDGSWDRRAACAQEHFAAEIRRIGRGYFVQTPHADFPVDSHLWLPGTNWLGHEAAVDLVRWTDRFWIKSCPADWRLLRSSDMRRLFPDASVQVERFAGLPKSIVAYRAASAA